MLQFICLCGANLHQGRCQLIKGSNLWLVQTRMFCFNMQWMVALWKIKNILQHNRTSHAITEYLCSWHHLGSLNEPIGTYVELSVTAKMFQSVDPCLYCSLYIGYSSKWPPNHWSVFLVCKFSTLKTVGQLHYLSCVFSALH